MPGLYAFDPGGGPAGGANWWLADIEGRQQRGGGIKLETGLGIYGDQLKGKHPLRHGNVEGWL